jgi:uncharacterized protein YhaN
MKIMEIYIYGYGKFENVKFSNLHNQQVFYGENEAGKSTIMSFIHSILFGFPTKQQTELRYEPKKGAKYGGQLTVFFPGKGKAVIERVKGKAIGDVSVHIENGMIGGEELLKELLSSVDKNLFQSIFSFNLQGLQNVHQIKGEDLGRFLFSTGTVGSDRLLKAENELAKELESRFKPNGRNPLLNTKLKELRSLRTELQKVEETNGQYTSLLTKRESIEKQIEESRSEIISLTEQQTRLEEWKKVAPLFQQEKIIQKELIPYDHLNFPENGLEQLERLKIVQIQLERKIHILKQRMDSLQADMKAIQPNLALLEKENEINRIVESLSLLEKWKQDHNQLHVKLKNMEEEIQRLQNNIHLPLSTNDLLSANTSVFIKGKVDSLKINQQRLTEKKRELDEQFQVEKKRLEELESEDVLLQSQLMPETDRKELIERLDRIESSDTLAKKRQQVKDRLALLTASQQHATNKGKKEKWQFLFMAMLFMILCGWGIASEELLLVLVGGIGLLVAILFYIKSKSTVSDEVLQTEIKNLQEQKMEFEKQWQQPVEHVSLLKQKLEKDSLLREQSIHVKVNLERQQEQYHHVIDRFELWEQESAELQKELLDIGEQLKIPEEIALKYLFDAFQMIDTLKKLLQEKFYTIEQMNLNQEAIQKIKLPLRKLSLQFLNDDQLSPHEVALTLKKKLKVELEKQIQFNEKNDQLGKLQNELEEDQFELDRVLDEMVILFSTATAQNEDHFREMGKKAALKEELMNQWNSLLIQIKLSSFTKEEAEELSNNESVELSIQKIMDMKDKRNSELSQLHDDFASLKYNIQRIEDGGTYADLLHRFKQLKSEFEDDAREWARFATAKEILQTTINNFKKVRLPKMLHKAEEYLSFLTDGNYCRILTKQEGNGFLIESKDHLLYEANELSQATTEQIYVSLRLALAVTIYEKYKFPIIIDDSFVNFDARRTSKVVELLKQLDGQQVLFFTCHEHLLKYFQWAEVIHLSEKRLVDPSQQLHS